MEKTSRLLVMSMGVMLKVIGGPDGKNEKKASM